MSADETDAISGQCLCGDVRIELREPKRMVELCHCDMCRRWGGAFYAALGSADVAIQGEASVTVYRSSEWAERAFCGQCGSSLWFRFLPTGTRSFSAGLFDSAIDFPVEREIFTDEAASWCRIAGEHPRLTAAEIWAEARAAGFTLG